ncbi:MAG: hypothetical protein OEL76_02520 [Siculibacillus sp.]|nr:hypothetical protein [Siculibacillus sp.]
MVAAFLIGSVATANASERCEALWTDLTGRCALEAQKTAAPGDFSYFSKCRSRHEADYRKCLSGGTTGASVAAPPEGCGEAREAIDWIFRDGGATRTYSTARRNGQGILQALITAQSHNGRAQTALRDCANWAVAYAGPRDTGGAPLGGTATSGPKPADCRCISVLPNGSSFSVTNSCSTFEVSVNFTDASTNGGLAGWVNAGRVGPAEPATIRAPATYRVPSIRAVEIRNGAGSFVCRY